MMKRMKQRGFPGALGQASSAGGPVKRMPGQPGKMTHSPPAAASGVHGLSGSFTPNARRSSFAMHVGKNRKMQGVGV
jgi:hypothetical protein